MSCTADFGFAASNRFDGRSEIGQMGQSRLFITGGTGFFGKSMLDYRLRHPGWPWANAEWVILSRSPTRFATAYPQLANQPGVSFVAGDVRDFVSPTGPFDAIIHAATSAVTTFSDAEMTSVILDGARHVADFAKAVDCKNILFTSSGAVYGPQIEPVSETGVCCPATAYGKGKLAVERMFVDLDFNVKIARCFAFIGPYLNRTIHFAVGNFIQDCLDGNPITINGDGTPLRSYLYADDLVEWLFAILERGKPGRPYNVGSDHALSILELAKRVRHVLGTGNEISVKGKPELGVKPSVYVPEIGRAQGELGLSVSVPLDEAIRRTVVPR